MKKGVRIGETPPTRAWPLEPHSGDNGPFTKRGNPGFKGRPSSFGGGTTDQTHSGLLSLPLSRWPRRLLPGRGLPLPSLGLAPTRSPFPRKGEGRRAACIHFFFNFNFFCFGGFFSNLNLFIYGCTRSLAAHGLSWAAMHGLLVAVTSLTPEQGLLSSCGSRAQLSHGVWDLPGPGIEPVSPALAS